MFRNYLKVAFRHLLRHKEYSFINILGLTAGITCCILIFLFVQSEFSYDKFHSKSARIYRSWVREKYVNQDDIIDITTPLPLARALQSSFPEVESTSRVFSLNSLAKIDKNAFPENITMVDSGFFTMFDFQLLQGNRMNPFPNSNSIILTESTAKKYFGNLSPIGRNIEFEFPGDTIVFTVSGIAAAAPEESSIRFNALISSANEQNLFSERARNSWFNVIPETYVLLKKEASAEQLTKKFPPMVKQYLGESYKEGMYLVNLQPITQIHLDNSLPQGLQPVSDPKYSYILLSIGLLILLVACINFITLSVGRSASRAREVGVRKVMGAGKAQLLGQFWGEALLLTLLSIVMALLVSFVLLQPFNHLINRQLSIHFDIPFIGMCLLLVVIIGLIAGLYPGLVLSHFKPVEVLKGKLKIASEKGLLRKGLVTGQFVASIAMMVCTLIIGQQLNYLQNRDLGYHKEQIIVVETNKPRVKGTELANLYRNELLKQPQFIGATVSLMSFSQTPWIGVGYTDDKAIYRDFQFNAVDPYFVKTMGMKIIRGRDFSANDASDNTSSMLVNEALVKQFGLKNPIGQKLPGKIDQTIIGVVEDFNYESLHTTVKPLAMVIKPDSFFRRIENVSYTAPAQPRISIRLKAGNMAAAINTAKQTWKSVAGEQAFDYRFLDEDVAAQYRQEQRIATVVKLASGLSILISCIGLFGLATLTVVKRTKEIGIRKVLGASVGSIISLLSKDFLQLVLVAIIIASPAAWYLMNQWLQSFAYRTDVGWVPFVIAGLSVCAVALITMSFQTIKAAIANPVKSLRTE